MKRLDYNVVLLHAMQDWLTECEALIEIFKDDEDDIGTIVNSMTDKELERNINTYYAGGMTQFTKDKIC